VYARKIPKKKSLKEKEKLNKKDIISIGALYFMR
jgi:hypothetical protein